MNILKKRRYPRRRYFRKVGVLFKGDYKVGQGMELGEGGMRLAVDTDMGNGANVVLSFQVSDEVYVITKAEIRYSGKKDEKGRFVYGVMFHDIGFEKKRAIRDYIAAKTEAEAESELQAAMRAA